ncbi:MAG: hypothetical protein KDA28_04210, partial [Phycisphaerales bacterium]|nr:hypothetical protein [Phycisphaerales bacterium]
MGNQSPDDTDSPTRPFSRDREDSDGEEHTLIIASAPTTAGDAAPADTGTSPDLDAEVLAAILPSRYVCVRQIGVGGMGEVWQVRDGDLGRTVALKVLRGGVNDADAIERFVEEAQVCAQLEHPGVVSVHDVGRLADGRVFYTMREIRGRTFGQVVLEAHGHALEASPAER